MAFFNKKNFKCRSSIYLVDSLRIREQFESFLRLVFHSFQHIPLFEQHVPQFMQIRIWFDAKLLNTPCSANAYFIFAPVFLLVEKFHKVMARRGAMKAGSSKVQRTRSAVKETGNVG